MLLVDEAVDAVFDGAGDDELVHEHVLPLTDAEGAVGGLAFDRGIPPAIEVDDVIRGGERESSAAGFDADDEERRTIDGLEALDQLGALRDGRAAVQHETGAAKDVREMQRKRVAHLGELREHNRALLTLREFVRDLREAHELATVLGLELTVAAPVARVVAHLLELEQEAEREAVALEGLQLRIGKRALQFFDEARVDRGLLAGQRAVRLHLDLVRQIADDAAIRFHATQQPGLNEVPQRRVVGAESFERLRELRGTAEQAGIEEVKETPQVAGPVLHRCASQSDASVGLQFLHRLRLLRAGVLDRLRFIEHHEMPAMLHQGGAAREQGIRGDHDIDTAQHRIGMSIERVEVIAGSRGAMRDEDSQRGRELGEFVAPVADQGRRRNDHRRTA